MTTKNNLTLIPTLDDLTNSLLIAIASHPWVQDPPAFMPGIKATGKFKPSVVKIIAYRNYDGEEYIQPGLTLSVFPAYYKGDTANAYTSGAMRSMRLSPDSLGNATNSFYHDNAIILMVVKLTYQDLAITNTAGLTVEIDKSTPDWRKTAPWGEYLYHSANLPNSPHSSEFSINIEINQAESMIRRWMELLRNVVNSINTIPPFYIKSHYVHGINLPSTSWMNEGVWFHKASMLVEYNVGLPSAVAIANNPRLEGVEVSSYPSEDYKLSPPLL